MCLGGYSYEIITLYIFIYLGTELNSENNVGPEV